MRKKIARGFTLIELMVVVAIIGILAAIAIPAFMKNAKKAKTTEATINIKKLADGAVTYYHEELNTPGTAVPIARQFPDIAGAGAGATSADIEPAAPCCPKKCAPSAALWSGPAWQALKFSMDDPHYYAYQYSHDQNAGTIAAVAPQLGTGNTAAEYFYVDAVGDLNCDGTFSTFEMFGGVDPIDHDVSLSAGHSESNPLE